MDLSIRSTRSLKVTNVRISAEEAAQLAQLAMDPRYEVLVNVMERACIELDTGFINAPVSEPEAILGAHCVAKAGWLFFTWVQRAVQNAYHTHTGAEVRAPEPDLNDILQGVQ